MYVCMYVCMWKISSTHTAGTCCFCSLCLVFATVAKQPPHCLYMLLLQSVLVFAAVAWQPTTLVRVDFASCNRFSHRADSTICSESCWKSAGGNFGTSRPFCVVGSRTHFEILSVLCERAMNINRALFFSNAGARCALDTFLIVGNLHV